MTNGQMEEALNIREWGAWARRVNLRLWYDSQPWVVSARTPDPVIEHEYAYWLSTAVASIHRKLSPEIGDVIVMSYVNRDMDEEIARHLRMSRATVRHHRRNGLCYLMALLPENQAV